MRIVAVAATGLALAAGGFAVGRHTAPEPDVRKVVRQELGRQAASEQAIRDYERQVRSLGGGLEP